METKDEYMKKEKEALGEQEFNSMYPLLDNDYYKMVENHVKQDKAISKEVYDSLSEGQRYHFNKHYNYRQNMVLQDKAL